MKNRIISDLELERYLLGELESRKIKEIDNLLTRDKTLSERLDLMKKSNEEILSRYKPSEMAARIEHRLAQEQIYTSDKAIKQSFSGEESVRYKNVLPRFRSYIPVLSLILLALIIIPVIIVNTGKVDNLRSKGQSYLLIYLKTASGVELLKNGDTARQGDIIQLGYYAGGQKFGTIFSIDGRGSLTWHFPVNLQADTILEQGRRTLLPESYELDNAPKFERFFFITFDKRINLSNIMSIAEILAKDPESSDKNSLKLFKEEKVFVFTLIKRD